uniref:Heme peroxidase n=1 Tax=Megaselia scalaris TaxID=36166 RepID=T1GQF0_MEGSC
MGMRCCSEDYQHALPNTQSHHSCLPFEIPPGDRYFMQMNPQPRCHNFIRTQPIFHDNCTVSAAEQVNMPSHFIDLSVIYPLTMEKLKSLRMFSGGLFKLDEKMIMVKMENCEANCFFAGDFRAAGFASLAVVHSIFMRLHNMLAMQLAKVNPQWNDDMLFFEARKITIGMYQHIVYNEYIPSMLGQTSFAVAGDGDYDKNMDPRTLNEFSNTAFRYLHIYTPDVINLYNDKMQVTMSSAISNVM